MNNRDGLCFTLENSLAAVSAALKGGFVYATDGAECKVYRIAECVCGCFYTTRRPYRRLRFDPGSGGERGTALSGDCRRIFGFCGDFYETGYLEPDVPSGGYLTDANVFLFRKHPLLRRFYRGKRLYLRPVRKPFGFALCSAFRRGDRGFSGFFAGLLRRRLRSERNEIRCGNSERKCL